MLSATVLGSPRLKIAKLAEGLAHSILEAKKRYASAVLRELISQTPKLSGQASANWQVSLGLANDVFIQLPEAVRSKTYDAQSVDDALTFGLETIQSLENNQTIYINNNAPYIVLLNQGHSVQAPAGYVEAILQNALSELHKIGVLA